MLEFPYKLVNSLGLSRCAEWVTHPRAAILMCHSIGPQTSGFSPNKQWTISEQNLETAAEQAASGGYTSSRLTDLQSQLQNTTAEKKFWCLTFDDGYRDNLTIAAPMCRALGIPMTVFVTTGFVCRTHTAWWHFLEHLVKHNGFFSATTREGRQRFECQSDKSKATLYAQLSEQLMDLDSDGQQAFISSVSDPERTDAISYAQSLFLDLSELQKLASDPNVELGLHGVSHAPFSNMTAAVVRRELADGIEQLKQVSQQTSFPLAYPHGTAATFGFEHRQIANELGIKLAVSTQHGCIMARDRTDFLLVPRLPLFPSDGAASLQVKLSGLSTLLARAIRPLARAA